MKFDTTTHMLLETDSVTKRALIFGVAGLVLTLLGFFKDHAQFFQAYLVSFTFLTTISLGGLFFVLIHHVTGAYWGTVLRRVAENIADTLPIMALFMIPLFFGMHDLYHWTHEDAVSNDQVLQWKEPYLNVGFFIVRSILYFAVWLWLSRGLKKLSLAQDEGEDTLPKMRRRAAGGIVLFAITVTGFAFDWIMSLDPHWYSTIFGVYVFSGGFWAALGLIAIFASMLRKSGAGDLITVEHTHDLGKFMFAFTVWWAYIGASQYFLIWYGNIPEETLWFLHRWEHGWKNISLFLIAFHFIVPFIVLAFRASKRVPALVLSLAGLFLVMHYVDHFWLVGPNFNDNHLHISWMHLTVLLGMGGIYMWWFFYISARNPMVALKDPNLEKSTRHVVH